MDRKENNELKKIGIEHSDSTSTIGTISTTTNSDDFSDSTIHSSPPAIFSPSDQEKRKNTEYLSALQRNFSSKVSDAFYSFLYNLEVEPEEWKKTLQEFKRKFLAIHENSCKDKLQNISEDGKGEFFLEREFSWKTIDNLIYEEEKPIGAALRRIARTKACLSEEVLQSFLNEYSVYYSPIGIDIDEIVESENKQGSNIFHEIAYLITDKFQTGESIRKDDWSSFLYIEKKYSFLKEKKNKAGETPFDIVESVLQIEETITTYSEEIINE